MDGYLLGIDIGGTVAKVSVFDVTGHCVATMGEVIPTQSPSVGYVERDMGVLWAAVCQTIRQTLAGSNIDARRILAIAPCGHGKGLYALDGKGRPACNGILSADSRARAIVASAYGDDYHGRLYPRLKQPLWPGHTSSLALWIKRNNPPLYASIRWVLSCKDYIRYKLTGHLACEYTDLSGSGLCDPTEKALSRDLLEQMGLGDLYDRLPEVVSSTAICGGVTREASRLTGLVEGTPVAGGLFDVCSCAVSSGVLSDEDCFAIAGTWSIVGFLSRCAQVGEGLVDEYAVQKHCVEGFWMVHEASPNSASNLDWCIRTFLKPLIQEKALFGENLYACCDRLVAQTTSPSSQLVFSPLLYGDNSAKGIAASLIGMDVTTDLSKVLLAVYEGIVFHHKGLFEKLARTGQRPHMVRFIGGLTRSEPWMQMYADCLDLPVAVMDTQEAGTHGAALCAGVAVGVYRDFNEAVQKGVRVQRIIEPEREAVEVYQEKYRQYLEAQRAMEGFWT